MGGWRGKVVGIPKESSPRKKLVVVYEGWVEGDRRWEYLEDRHLKKKLVVVYEGWVEGERWWEKGIINIVIF